MNSINIKLGILNKMYYLPPVYYWIDNDHNYDIVKNELKNRLEESKKNFYKGNECIVKKNKSEPILMEKSIEYINYKSNLIRLILIDYAHFFPNNKGKDLLNSIIEKWEKSINISSKMKQVIYDRTINNIIKYEKTINNIEEIMMYISLQILENYYN